MLLAIDVGNTETVIGLFGPDHPTAPDAMGFARASGERGLAYHWRISTVAERTPDELAMVLTQLLDLEGLDLRAAVTAIAFSEPQPDAPKLPRHKPASASAKSKKMSRKSTNAPMSLEPPRANAARHSLATSLAMSGRSINDAR